MKACVIAVSLVVGMGANAAAQAATQPPTYPSRPIRLIVPFVPGGSADLFARMLAPELADKLGQQVVVDNRGGASGTIGNEIASKAAPDGYTMVIITANAATSVSLYPNAIDPSRDLQPVSLLGSAPNIVAVHPSLPAKSMKDLIALAKAKPGELRYASGGTGSTPHLAAELLKTMAGINLLHVPYKGTGPAVVAVLGGESSIVVPPASAVLAHEKSGKLRALAISSASRFEALPNMPTVAESGVAGYEASQWYGVMVPKGTPPAVVARLNAELVKLVQSADFKSRMLAQATMVSGTSPDAFARYLQAEIAKWAKVIKAAGIKVD